MARVGRLQASDLMRGVTLEVEITGVRSLRLRLWLARRLLWVDGKILGVGKIEVKGQR